MLMSELAVIVDPIKILSEEEADLLLECEDIQSTWDEIKERHGIDTNVSKMARHTIQDIFLFHNNVLKGKAEHSVDEEVPDIVTESCLLVGIEFKDLKKFNKYITPEDLEEATVIQCHKVSMIFGSDEEGEFISATFSVENPEYNPDDENSKKYKNPYIEWKNSYIDPSILEEELADEIQSEESIAEDE